MGMFVLITSCEFSAPVLANTGARAEITDLGRL